jgi:hypothetical protein
MQGCRAQTTRAADLPASGAALMGKKNKKLLLCNFVSPYFCLSKKSKFAEDILREDGRMDLKGKRILVIGGADRKSIV